MKNKILLTLFLITNTVFANVFDSKSEISSFINQIPVMESVSCEFKQEKIINGIKKPLVSGGNFKFIKDKGVYFETLYPIKSTTQYSTNEFKQINSVINAISNKKYKKLENEFDFYFKKENNIWFLGLKPKKTSSSSKFISTIEIQGTNYINKIIINTTNKDKITQWYYLK